MPNQKSVVSWLSVVFVISLLAVLLLPLPRSGGTAVGHAAGIIGSLLILLTLVYPFRKRILGKKGRKNPITTHMIFGLLGSILLVVHSGGVLTSLTVSLVFLVLIVVVLSGISGRFLYSRIRRTLKEYQQESSHLKDLFQKRVSEISLSDATACFRFDLSFGGFDLEGTAGEGGDAPTMRQCQELERTAEASGDVEYSIQVYDAVQKLFGKWSQVHIYLVFFLFALMAAHIATVVFYGLPWL